MNCFLCDKVVIGTDQKLNAKGIAGIINFRKKRNDNKWCALENMGPEANIFVHDKCWKDYTRSKGIEQQKHKVEEEAASVAGTSAPKNQTLCSVSQVFSFYTRCLFCGEEVDKEKEKERSIKYQQKVCTLEFKGTVLWMCNDRKDLRGRIIEKRLANIRDLVSEEALPSMAIIFGNMFQNWEILR